MSLRPTEPDVWETDDYDIAFELSLFDFETDFEQHLLALSLTAQGDTE